MKKEPKVVKTEKPSPPCHFCFLECERRISTRGNGSPYPCSTELRLWAKQHRNDPPGLVIED